MRSTSSRKGQTSITHLMNFSLPPRPQASNATSYGRHVRRNPTWGLGSGYHAVDKARYACVCERITRHRANIARYIHANYRFIVDPSGDYRKQVIDADAHLEWSNVLQILASAQSQVSSCPICLSAPVAPRMARCGHIFCLPCLIRFMHSTDESAPAAEKKSRWKKCPICWDSVYMSEVKPVRFFQGQEGPSPRDGDDVVLKLMIREPGQTLALPKDGADFATPTEDIPWYFAAEAADYAHIMKGSEDYMVSSFDLEIEQVQVQEQEDELMFGEESEWSKKAVSTIRELTERVRGIGNPAPRPEQQQQPAPQRPPIEFLDRGPDFYSFQHATKAGQSVNSQPQNHQPTAPPGASDNVERNEIPREGKAPNAIPAPAKHAAPQRRQPGSPFYFYQALSHYYLSPLDIRILKAEFGDYSSFPAAILPRVERISTGHVVDEDLRRRAKYLGHLPGGCEVSFLECDWSDLVSPEVLATFRGELDRRRKQNREKEAREEKERVRAEKEEEDKRWAAARRRRPSISKARDLSPIPSPDVLLATPPNAFEQSTESSSPPWGSLPQRSGSAFASLASPSTSPSTARTVWGTVAIASKSPVLAASPKPPPTENDGWLQNWEQDLLNDEELTISRVKEVSLNGEGSSAAPKQSTGKKKKQKKITLMTTNARRAA